MRAQLKLENGTRIYNTQHTHNITLIHCTNPFLFPFCLVFFSFKFCGSDKQPAPSKILHVHPILVLKYLFPSPFNYFFSQKRKKSNPKKTGAQAAVIYIYLATRFCDISACPTGTIYEADLEFPEKRSLFEENPGLLVSKNSIKLQSLGSICFNLFFWFLLLKICVCGVNMEIDRAVRECEDRRLQTKYNNATYVIQRALALYSIEEVAFSFNGGKDSTVLLHLLRAGYFLHKGGQNSANGDLKDFPIRTIYFESPSAFPEINSFTYDTAATYGLQIDTISLDFKSGLEALLKEKPIRAIFLGVRIGDPTAIGQEQFSPSSPGWPPFMRVNPILDWSYRDVWAFLLTCKVNYCSLYDQGYTSIGSIHDTVPNSLLSISKSSNKFKPAYLLADGRLERAGRVKRLSSSTCVQHSADSNGLLSLDSHKNSMLTASVIAVGDEILFGIVEDQLGPNLCRKLHSIGWSVLQLSVVHNNIDSVAEEVERQKSISDVVFIYGGVGPLHSDVTLAGIAKAFGVRLAPDEEFEEYLRHIIGDQCTGDRNEMAQLPEGITELLQHDKLSVPLIKCENVIVLSATNVVELEKQWECLIELTKSSDLLTLLEPFVSKQVTTNLLDVELAQPLSKLCLEFPDLYIGCYRAGRGYLVISLKGKDQARLEAAIKALDKKFQPGAFREMN